MPVREYNLIDLLKKSSEQFRSVVQFNPAKEKLIQFDFTESDETLKKIDLSDTEKLSEYINDLLQNENAKFGIGGYNELRNLYSRSSLFNNNINNNFSAIEEPRRLHLGIDIWGKEGTKIFAPIDLIFHSFSFNNYFGDYGSTIILQHQLDEVNFFALYGHLSLADLQNIKEGDYIKSGQQFAHFGKPGENGYWPPHLHFQVIEDMENYKGDYPGVCKFSEREKYLANCPDPDLILNMNRFQV
ncbi:MAG: peptidoglycan DD-metalloendopeptidase family protein [Bacteroidia bacterium]